VPASGPPRRAVRLHGRPDSLSAVADCLFCGIVEGSVPSQTIDSDERTVAFMDIAPATPGHALVVPRNHSADLLEIDPDDLSATVSSAQRLARHMNEVLNPDGVNLLNSCGAAAWQTVFHFHIHVVPRYEDDPLKLPWVPKEGDPDEIARMAGKLREGAPIMRGRAARRDPFDK
jgi:histidine triad (HIT) family protein